MVWMKILYVWYYRFRTFLGRSLKFDASRELNEYFLLDHKMHPANATDGDGILRCKDVLGKIHTSDTTLRNLNQPSVIVQCYIWFFIYKKNNRQKFHHCTNSSNHVIQPDSVLSSADASWTQWWQPTFPPSWSASFATAQSTTRTHSSRPSSRSTSPVCSASSPCSTGWNVIYLTNRAR